MFQAIFLRVLDINHNFLKILERIDDLVGASLKELYYLNYSRKHNLNQFMT